MPAILSGNTLGLKFMQRGAAAKAATEARQQEEAKKQAELKRQSKPNEQDSSEDEDDSSEESDDSDSARERTAGPVASTSTLPGRQRSTITTESSYLAFPILSSAYGVASSNEAGPSVNGRFSFGEPTKKQTHKSRKSESVEDLQGNCEEAEGSRQIRTKGTVAVNKTDRARSISSNGSALSSQPSIREQQRARARAKEAKVSHSDEEHHGTGAKYEEDTSFVDDMMKQARQKRQMGEGHIARKKKRKSGD